MQSSLKKSLYLGLAALSFASVAAVSTNASAKSYAKAGAETDLTASKKDANVESTGTNALFTKPGTTKGAKVVASKATMKKLANSGKSADYFWAYRTTTTNKGAVYYKVVSMNGKYRGYVYAGKTEGEFNRGLKKADTVTKATTPVKTSGYYLKNVSKNTLWTAPKNTERHAKKVSLYGAAKDDSFVVDKAETKTRENTLYYHVTDSNDASISGWIYAGKGYDAALTPDKQSMGGLSFDQSDAAATVNNSVTINYRDNTTNNFVSKATYVTATKNTKENDPVATGDKNAKGTLLSDFVSDKANVPAGYQVVGTPSVANAVFGGTVTVMVEKTATSTISFWLPSTDGVTAGTQLTASDFFGGKPSITTENKAKLTAAVGSTIPDVDTFFTGIDSVVKYAPSDDFKVQTSDTDDTEVSLSKGDAYHVYYTPVAAATKTANSTAKMGDDLKVVLSPVNVKGTPGTQNGGDNTTEY